MKTQHPLSPSPSPAITVSALRFSYRPATAESPLVDVTELTFLRGRITVLTGENGSGKTTVLKLLAGLLTPDAGTISSGAGAAPLLVHQRPYIFADSVIANVMWPLRIRRIPRREARARATAALAHMHLDHLSHRWAPSLSGGEKQRAAIARALVLNPSVLLLDEPTSNIDADSVALVERVLTERAAAGTTVIMTTHNHESAYRLADAIVPLRGGRVQRLSVNVLRGRMEDPGDGHIGRFRVATGREILCPAISGTYTTAVIRMDDIILSREEITTSAQNHLPGTVTAVTDVRDELVHVELDCGFPLGVVITARSVTEFDVAPGTHLWASFKASAVRVY